MDIEVVQYYTILVLNSLTILAMFKILFKHNIFPENDQKVVKYNMRQTECFLIKIHLKENMVQLQLF